MYSCIPKDQRCLTRPVLPEGPWKQIPGGVTAVEGFKAAGIYGGLRAKGEKPDLAVITCDIDATSAGSFTTNVVTDVPVLYCKRTLDISKMIKETFQHVLC